MTHRWSALDIQANSDLKADDSIAIHCLHVQLHVVLDFASREIHLPRFVRARLAFPLINEEEGGGKL